MNRIEDLRNEKGWTQQQLSDAVNDILRKNPDLRKVTKKNPEGYTDQKTIQRIEKGGIELNRRWLEIMRAIFAVTSSDILGETSDEEFQFIRAWRNTNARRRQAIVDLLGKEQ
jgi:transcriptional regulator with XRE-family HTH domain